MHASTVTVLALALVFTAAPAFSAPVTLDTRSEAVDIEQSDAIRAPVVFHIGTTVLPSVPNDPTGNLSPFFDRFPISKREEIEMLVRGVQDDGSGASLFSSLAKDAFSIFGHLFDGGSSNSINGTITRRDLEELFARATQDDESGASFLTSLFKGAFSLFGGLFGGNSDSSSSNNGTAVASRRDLEELFARAVQDDESGASFLTGLFKGAFSLFGDFFGGNSDSSSISNNGTTTASRRDFEQLIARALKPQHHGHHAGHLKANAARYLNELD